jgi:protoporphyrinogen oxidase
MKIAVIGGGISGLVCAEKLSRVSEHSIKVIECEDFFGGLATGFSDKKWDWTLERAYHHIFSNDKEILNYLTEIGYTGFRFNNQKTSWLYRDKSDYKSWSIDSLTGLMKFPHLNFVEKIICGLVVLMAKFLPYHSALDKISAYKLFTCLMGERVYRTLFGAPMQKKFGEYAENISSAFMWARIKKRSKKLGYPTGGFQMVIDYLVTSCIKQGVEMTKNRCVVCVSEIFQDGHMMLEVEYMGGEKEIFDYVVSTMPSAIARRAFDKVLNHEELKRLDSIRHLASINIILETREKIFEDDYWVSDCVEDSNFLVFVQHTNLVDKKNYGGNHILYAGCYLPEGAEFWQNTDDELIDLCLAQIREYTGKSIVPTSSRVFRAKNSQPVFTVGFEKIIPKMNTSNKHLLFANLDMTYPFDRGTNYATKLGLEASESLLKQISADKN